jgi:hypothetical protein
MDARDVGVVGMADLCARMPLAEAAFAMWRFVFDEQRLDALWDRHRGRCCDRVISFPTMVYLVADALLLYRGSGRRSFEKHIAAGQLPASFQAAFGKLGRLPLEVSQAFLREGTAAFRELLPDGGCRQLPASLGGFAALLIDGKTIKNVAKRLKPLRGVGGGLLGGKAVVALEWTSGLALAMQTHPDGDASEKRLVAGLVPQTDGMLPGPRLFVADRGFCDLVNVACFTARPGDHFLVRHHAGTKFIPDASRPERPGFDNRNRRFVETWGWLGAASNRGRRYVRRIDLPRPDAGEDLVLMTDLLDAEACPGTDVLWLYQERWGIERMFQKVTEVFDLKHLIGSTPQACLFQFAFCLHLYNLVQVLTCHIARGRQRDPEELSKEKLFDDVRRELTAWNVVFGPGQTLGHFQAPATAHELQFRLREILAPAWNDTWLKSPQQKNRKVPHRETKRGHGSVWRILQAHATPPPKPGNQRC